MCLNTVCQNSPQAPKGSCLYADAMISQNDTQVFPLTLSSPIMTCSALLSYAPTQGVPAMSICLNSDLGQKCCGACASKEKEIEREREGGTESSNIFIY
jgi:hypothetical protein